MDQEQPLLPIFQRPAETTTSDYSSNAKMPRQIMVPASTPVTPTIATASTTGTMNGNNNKSSTVELGAMEEFLIGCASGIIGAAMSWVKLSGLSWLVCVLVLPWMALEFWESYALFLSASSSSSAASSSDRHKQNVDYNTALHLISARKRLARQLFGQGVIMGQAALDLTKDDNELEEPRDQIDVLISVTLYATLWLVWIVVCHMNHATPPEDKLAKFTQVKRQQQHDQQRQQLQQQQQLQRKRKGIRRTFSGGRRRSTSTSVASITSCSTMSCTTSLSGGSFASQSTRRSTGSLPSSRFHTSKSRKSVRRSKSMCPINVA